MTNISEHRMRFLTYNITQFDLQHHTVWLTTSHSLTYNITQFDLQHHTVWLTTSQFYLQHHTVWLTTSHSLTYNITQFDLQHHTVWLTTSHSLAGVVSHRRNAWSRGWELLPTSTMFVMLWEQQEHTIKWINIKHGHRMKISRYC